MAEKASEPWRRLSAVPPDKFTAARDELVRELRAKDEAGEAKIVAGLRKPSVALWIANQLARLAPADVEALIEATARLQRGQSGAARGTSADELRDAMRAQREVLARLADAAGKAAQEAETHLTPALQRRVQNTVQAAAASEPQSLREGRLESELQPSGFDGLLGAAPPPEKAGEAHEAAAHPHEPDAAAERARKREEAARKKEEAARAQALRKAEQEAHRLDAVAKKLEHRAAAREQEAARSRQEADAARRKAEEAAARARELK